MATFFPIFLIEKLGRRKILLMSVIGVLISMILVGTGFFMINKDSAKIISNPTNSWFKEEVKDYDLCRKYS